MNRRRLRSDLVTFDVDSVFHFFLDLRFRIVMSGVIINASKQFSLLFLGTSRSDDSAGDRLSYRYTSAILVAFTLIVSNGEFTMKRIQCWVRISLHRGKKDDRVDLF